MCPFSEPVQRLTWVSAEATCCRGADSRITSGRWETGDCGFVLTRTGRARRGRGRAPCRTAAWRCCENKRVLIHYAEVETTPSQPASHRRGSSRVLSSQELSQHTPIPPRFHHKIHLSPLSPPAPSTPTYLPLV
ncbi:hypothetical protein E2C01_003257 [Portunus trituberculatus]|uniref:Uncharacterized protein n=1 Tax=Portunus trituberculatus TaxID=210409 RepID=A0A5B7CMF8_PORTR|nr:hypothetical protein [Portunus trituberculatus]